MSKLHDVIDSLLKVRDDSLVGLGCGDGNCCIRRPKGQHTNGGCKCCYYPEDRFIVERALRINQRFCEDVSRAIKDYG